jgi:hypothetical protein
MWISPIIATRFGQRKIEVASEVIEKMITILVNSESEALLARSNLLQHPAAYGIERRWRLCHTTAMNHCRIEQVARLKDNAAKALKDLILLLMLEQNSEDGERIQSLADTGSDVGGKLYDDLDNYDLEWTHGTRSTEYLTQQNKGLRENVRLLAQLLRVGIPQQPIFDTLGELATYYNMVGRDKSWIGLKYWKAWGTVKTILTAMRRYYECRKDLELQTKRGTAYGLWKAADDARTIIFDAANIRSPLDVLRTEADAGKWWATFDKVMFEACGVTNGRPDFSQELYTKLQQDIVSNVDDTWNFDPMIWRSYKECKRDIHLSEGRHWRMRSLSETGSPGDTSPRTAPPLLTLVGEEVAMKLCRHISAVMESAVSHHSIM